uniref:Uncharacterized protein n=1 Tax=Caenorhabditis japonica TaxID=281687 RepID=A0A8R1ED44_CAEJA
MSAPPKSSVTFNCITVLWQVTIGHNFQIGQSNSPLFEQLAMMAVYPHLRRLFYLNDSNLLSKITFGAAIVALAGFLVLKNL